jgi:AraC-like DNA-binding protein
MSVAARSASIRADPDIALDPRLAGVGTISAGAPVDLRLDHHVRAGTFEWHGPDVQTGWHRHPFHQVEYALEGVAEVETAAGRYLLPPQRAIWIPAGLEHHTILQSVHSISLFFDPGLVPQVDERARVLAVPPLVREMLVYGLQWPIGRTRGESAELAEERSEVFFAALLSVIVDGLADESPLHLPTTTDPLLAQVFEYTEANLATVTVAQVCSAVGLSERTLRRRSVQSIGITWQQYLAQSRLLRAAVLLADSDQSVAEVAVAVGYESQSAFARAFGRWMNESPSSYRQRMCGV